MLVLLQWNLISARVGRTLTWIFLCPPLVLPVGVFKCLYVAPLICTFDFPPPSPPPLYCIFFSFVLNLGQSKWVVWLWRTWLSLWLKGGRLRYCHSVGKYLSLLHWWETWMFRSTSMCFSNKNSDVSRLPVIWMLEGENCQPGTCQVSVLLEYLE